LYFKDITVLSLSYKNILKIQNLDGLFYLEKLQLDNNLIERIENLDHLVNLKWLGKILYLDLSFNCIKEIKGLEKLTQITDLSFYNN
jgi:Leucine-rich repeat (LRR) protein